DGIRDPLVTGVQTCALPILDQLCEVKQVLVQAHTLFIETAEPREMALEVLDEMEAQLRDADRFKGEAVELLQRGDAAKAMEKLGTCFRTWNNAHEAVVKTAELLRLDLEAVRIDEQSLSDLLGAFTGQLRDVK